MKGLFHAKLVNLIIKNKFPVFTVPRIYADELIRGKSILHKGIF